MLLEYKFLHPAYFWLLVPFTLAILASVFFDLKPRLRFTYGKSLKQSFRVKSLLRKFLLISTPLSLILVLAKPYKEHVTVNNEPIGRSICLVLDVSESMRSLDFKNNRLTFAKRLASQLIEKAGKSDKIAIVPFGSEAYIHSPLSNNKEITIFMLNQLEIGKLEGSSSAVGTGIAQGVRSLIKDTSSNKSVIVITDGSSLGLGVSTKDVIKFANEHNTKIHSIAIGRKGRVPFPIVDQYGNRRNSWLENDIDVTILENISKNTGGDFTQIKSEEANYNLSSFIEDIVKTSFYKKTVTEKVFYQKRMLYFTYLLACLLVIYLLIIEKPLSR